MEQFISLTAWIESIGATVSDGFFDLSVRQHALEKNLAELKVQQQMYQHKQFRALSQMAEHFQLDMSRFSDFSYESEVSEKDAGVANLNEGNEDSDRTIPLQSLSHSSTPSFHPDE